MTAFHGVNLGGWLLVERWMTPSLFEGCDGEDEFSLSSTPEGRARLQKHRQTFMTEEDWKWLVANDIRHVRLPVGFWVLKSDTPFVSAKNELDWAFRMAETYGVKILLDLHGLKGSQNGTMHSGKVGPVEWKQHRQTHFKTLQSLAERYGKSEALWGLEVNNEPTVPGNYFALLAYYRDAYKLLRTILPEGVYTVFQDGFLPILFSGVLLPRKGYPVVMDTHFYLLPGRIGYGLAPQSYDKLRTFVYRLAVWLSRFRQPVIVGEWSSILPQPMFDRVPQKDHLQLVGDTIHRQQKAYDNTLGTFYWNYKAEGRGMYNYRSLVEDSII